MDVNNISTNNFKGAFVLKPKTQQIREAIPNIIPKGRQIFRDIKTEGDVVIVTKDKYDKKVRDFIKAGEYPFAYYPEISTKSGLDDEIPSGLKHLMRIKNNCVVRNMNILDRFLVSRKPHLSEQSKYIQDAVDTLRLNTGSAKVQIDEKGIFFMRDEDKKRTIRSTGFRDGIAYVCVIPDSMTQDVRRFLVGKNGKEVIKEFITPSEMADFNRAFTKAIEK